MHIFYYILCRFSKFPDFQVSGNLETCENIRKRGNFLVSFLMTRFIYIYISGPRDPCVKTWISFLDPLQHNDKQASPIIGRPHFKTLDSVVRGSHSIIMIDLNNERTKFWVATWRPLNSGSKKGNLRLEVDKKVCSFLFSKLTVKRQGRKVPLMATFGDSLVPPPYATSSQPVYKTTTAWKKSLRRQQGHPFYFNIFWNQKMQFQLYATFLLICSTFSKTYCSFFIKLLKWFSSDCVRRSGTYSWFSSWKSSKYSKHLINT